MKKYRIVKLESDEYTTYCIQKRFLFFWWIDLMGITQIGTPRHIITRPSMMHGLQLEGFV